MDAKALIQASGLELALVWRARAFHNPQAEHTCT